MRVLLVVVALDVVSETNVTETAKRLDSDEFNTTEVTDSQRSFPGNADRLALPAVWCTAL
jgi:hypothetical protein